MAVASLIKLIPEPSTKGHSHFVGLLSLLAISGSVALLTLSGKLIKLSNTNQQYQEEEDETEEKQVPTVDGQDSCAGTATPSGRSAADCRDHGRKKRVHFAEDVREPRSDSREYRLRFAHQEESRGAVMMRRSPRRQSQYSTQMPANRVALYRGIRQYRLQHASSSCLSY